MRKLRGFITYGDKEGREIKAIFMTVYILSWESFSLEIHISDEFVFMRHEWVADYPLNLSVIMQ